MATVIAPDGRMYVFSTIKKAKAYVRQQKAIYPWRDYEIRPGKPYTRTASTDEVVE